MDLCLFSVNWKLTLFGNHYLLQNTKKITNIMNAFKIVQSYRVEFSQRDWNSGKTSQIRNLGEFYEIKYDFSYLQWNWLRQALEC